MDENSGIVTLQAGVVLEKLDNYLADFGLMAPLGNTQLRTRLSFRIKQELLAADSKTAVRGGRAGALVPWHAGVLVRAK